MDTDTLAEQQAAYDASVWRQQPGKVQHFRVLAESLGFGEAFALAYAAGHIAGQQAANAEEW